MQRCLMFSKVRPVLKHKEYGHRAFSNKHTIPMIDLAALDKSTNSLHHTILDALNCGVFYVYNHDVQHSLYANLLKQTEQFFNLPLHEKMNIHVSKGGIAWRGYMPIGGEQTHGKVDQKEGLYLGTDHFANHPRVLSNTPLFGMNQYPSPSVFPSGMFADTVNNYVSQTTQLGNKITTLISCALGLDEHYLMRHVIMNQPLSIFRLWKYPEISDANQIRSDLFGIGEHTDYGWLTLMQNSTNGLQFELDGQWTDVPPIKDAIIVSVGDLLDRMSYGRCVSRKHRVLQQSTDRYTAVLFYDPCWDCNMQYLPISDPLHNALDIADRQQRWNATAFKRLTGKYSDFLAQKVKRVFPELLHEYHCDNARAESTRFQIPVSDHALT